LESGSFETVRRAVKAAEKALRGVVVAVLDADLISLGLVDRIRVSKDGKKVAVFVNFSNPRCPFCRFINYVVWGSIVEKIERELREAGFEEVYIVDSVSGGVINARVSEPGRD